MGEQIFQLAGFHALTDAGAAAIELRRVFAANMDLFLFCTMPMSLGMQINCHFI
jgi:hypothetical protein